MGTPEHPRPLRRAVSRAAGMGALVVGTALTLALSTVTVGSGWWSVQRRWHGFDLDLMTYRDGEFELDHGVLRWDMRGERPMRGYFEDLVYWSNVRSAFEPLEGWTFWPALRASDDGNAMTGELRLVYPWAVAAGLTGFMWTRVVVAWRRGRRAGCCGKCGYDRRGLGEGAACPECGSLSATRPGAARV